MSNYTLHTVRGAVTDSGSGYYYRDVVMDRPFIPMNVSSLSVANSFQDFSYIQESYGVQDGHTNFIPVEKIVSNLFSNKIPVGFFDFSKQLLQPGAYRFYTGVADDLFFVYLTE